MEVNGHLITTATGNIGSPGSQCYTKAARMKVERRKELALQQLELEESLRWKIAELKELCLHEAELTGRLPTEYPLDPGEIPPLVDRRVVNSSRASDPSARPGEDPGLRELERRFELQQRIADGNRVLVARMEGQRTRRARGYDYAPRQLTDDGTMVNQRASGFPRDEDPQTAGLLHDERSSPRLDTWVDGRNVGRGSGWTLLPAEIYYHARGRRSSFASPVRMLQRSMSGTQRRSVPSSPVIYRDRAGQYR
uniref:coiled-coil domain-containing protein 120-like n=1 Tax=Pristiophorus japonicus TaxID=55135 RepID=UPI00398ECCAA